MSDYSEYIKPFLKSFDEACAKAFENGANNERERIIKLVYMNSHWGLVMVDEDLISIIKGETNG